jgi:Cu/Ag efflux protein CusF
MKVLQWLVAAGLICLVVLCGESSVKGESAGGSRTNVRSFDASGTIRELKPDGKTVVIQHEAISNYMDAMTMPFRVSLTNELAGLQPGDKVTFRLSVTDSESWIDQVRKTGRTNAPISASAPESEAQPPSKPINVVEGLSAYTFTNEFGKAMNFREFKDRPLALRSSSRAARFPNSVRG